MMDLKKNLQTYMTNFPGSFVGFFDVMAEILHELGDDWGKFASDKDDDDAKRWSLAFIKSAQTIKDLSKSFVEIRDEFDKREMEKNSPSNLIHDFKEKILEIKNAK